MKAGGVEVHAGQEWRGPGLYPDLSEEAYFADIVPGGSLSVTGARKLIPPSCPAIFDWQRSNPREPSAAMDLGKVAHRIVLGVGADVAVVEADDWRGKAAREARDEARANDQVPLLAKDFEVVKAMAMALAEHPLAGRLFQAGTGHPEMPAFWQDPETGVWCRARYDWLPDPVRGRRLLAADLKIARSAYPDDFGRTAWDLGYAMQAAHYLEGIRVLGLDERPAFIFVLVEKEPPYVVTVVELDQAALTVGAERVAMARRIYARCTAEGRWPGYTDEVERVSLPGWALAQHEEQEAAQIAAEQDAIQRRAS